MNPDNDMLGLEESGILFLDLEWNQFSRHLSKTDEIVEMGYVFLNVDNVIEKAYLDVKTQKTMCPHIKQLLRVDYNNLSKAVDVDRALDVLITKANCATTIVVWADTTKQMLRNLSKHYEVDFIGKVVCFQDILLKGEVLNKKIGFEDACISYISGYDPMLSHYAGYDAECLYKLFGLFRRAFKSYMVNGGAITDYLTDYDPEGKKRKLIGQIRHLSGRAVDKGDVGIIADFFHLSCHEKYGFYRVETEYSCWNVYLKDGYVTCLSHENYKNGEMCGFHRQEIKCKDIYGTFDYIAKHDSVAYKQTRYEECKRRYDKKQKKVQMQKQRKQITLDEKKNLYDF